MTWNCVTVHLESDEFEMCVDSSSGTASALLFLGDLRVYTQDPAALNTLVAAAAEARDRLAAEIAGLPPLPTEPEPVGDTGLTLGPLPVGVA